MFEMDFSERERGDNAFSEEDQKFLDIVKCGIGHQDGHYDSITYKGWKCIVTEQPRNGLEQTQASQEMSWIQ